MVFKNRIELGTYTQTVDRSPLTGARKKAADYGGRPTIWKSVGEQPAGSLAPVILNTVKTCSQTSNNK